MNRHQDYELRQYQSLPLHAKIVMTKQRIRQWYDYWDGNVYVSFSGGKDSTVLLDIARKMYPDIPAVFCDTGLEYPEIRNFAMSRENITVLKPKMIFSQIIRQYGYPLISKEVSEAIYYARRIGGGYATTDRRRLEVLGSRVYYETLAHQNFDRPTAENEPVRSNGGESTPTGRESNSSDRGHSETHRKRIEHEGHQAGVTMDKDPEPG